MSAYPPPPPPPYHPSAQLHSPTAPESTAPRRRSPLLVAALVVLAVLVVAAAVGVPVAVLSGSHNASAPTGGGAHASASPSANTAAALAAYTHAIAQTSASHGVHYVATTSGGLENQQIIGDAGVSGGTQQITLTSQFGNEQFTLRLVDGIVYFQGNAPALQDQLGVPSATAGSDDGKWISVAKGDGPYNVLEVGITVHDQTTELGLTPQSLTQVTQNGATLTRISGAVPPQNGAPAGTGHLDVDAKTGLPVTYVTTISASGVTLTSTTTFSNWGAAPSVATPIGAVAWTTLGASPPPGGYGNGGGGSSSAPSSPLSV